MPPRMSLLMLPSDVVEMLAMWIARTDDEPMRVLCAMDATSTRVVPPDDAWRLAARRTLGGKLCDNVVWEKVTAPLGRSACKSLMGKIQTRPTHSGLIQLVDAVLRDAADEVVSMVRETPRCVVQTSWPLNASETHWAQQSYMFKIGDRFGVALVELPDDARTQFAAIGTSVEWCTYVGVNQDPVTALKLPEFVDLACKGDGYMGSFDESHARRPFAVRKLFVEEGATSA